jgi:hypothetical protein
MYVPLSTNPMNPPVPPPKPPNVPPVPPPPNPPNVPPRPVSPASGASLQPRRSNAQADVQASVPRIAGFMEAVTQLSFLRSVPSQASLPSATPLPQVEFELEFAPPVPDFAFGGGPESVSAATQVSPLHH